MNESILSIQSCVSFGHVGNSAITFPLQRLGVQVWPIHTVLFSNHTGYGHWQGTILSVSVVKEIFQGIKKLGVMNGCQALLTGYMGSKDLGYTMLEIFYELKKLNPSLIYCCDPVMGDLGRNFFVKEGIPEFFKESLIKQATIITPNHFELEYLSGEKFNTVEGAIESAHKIMQHGPKVVLVTSLLLKNMQEDVINMLVVEKNTSYLISTPLLPITLNGTGDITAALFTHFYIKNNRDILKFLEETTDRIYSIIFKTHEKSLRELDLVSSQDVFIKPLFSFKAKKTSDL